MENKAVGRILLVFVLTLIGSPFQLVDAQTVTFTGLSLNIGNDGTVQERVPSSTIRIDSIVGITIAGGPTIQGTGLWGLHVFLTRVSTVTNLDYANIINGTVNSFTGADEDLQSGQPLSFNAVDVTFNLETDTCSDIFLICARIVKGLSPSTTFEIAQVDPTCQAVKCRGVVVSQVIPSITNRNQLKQGENNVLDISISIDANPEYGSVTGTSLTTVDVFASMEPDGSGIEYPATIDSTVAEMAGNYGISGPGSTIPRIEAGLNLAGVGCLQFSYVCVRMTRGANSNPRYTLTFDPPEANVACRELTCRGLEGVTSGTFSASILGEYKSSHVMTIPSITFTSNMDGGSVTSSNQQLWDIEIAAASAGSVIEATRVKANLQTGQTGQAFLGGGSLQFTSVTAVLNLGEYECTEIDQVAVRLLRHPQSPVDFTIQSQYYFQNADCRGVTITGITVTESPSTSNNGFPLRERTANQRMVFDTTFATDSRYGSVRGSNLWQIRVGISRVQSPDFGSLQSTAIAQLTQGQSDLDVEGGQSLALDGVQVSLTYDQVCASRNYFCVSISKLSERSVIGGADFQLSGQAVGCVEIVCTGVEITAISLTPVLPSPFVIVQHSTGVSFELTAVVSTNPNAGSGSTGDPEIAPWNMRVFLNSEESLDLSISGDVTGNAESQDFPSGSQTSVTINANVDLRSSCENMQFICLYIEQNVIARSLFTFEASRNIQFGCVRITDCTEVEIDQVTVTVIDESHAILENSGSRQTLTLGLQASSTTGSAMMDIGGLDYWQVIAFGSQSATGEGERVAVEVDVGLSAFQRAVPLTLFSDFGLISYEIFTSDIDCSRLEYVCLELLKNTLQVPSPDFSLRQSGIGCAPVNCVGVIIDQTVVEIVSGGVRERASENPVNIDLRMTTDMVSAGVQGMSLWSLTMFTATQSDGTGLQQIRRELQPGDWSNAPVINGEAELSGIMLNFDLTVIGCEQIPYVCVTVSKNMNPTPEFSLSPVSPSSLTGCSPLPCDGLTVSPTSVALSQSDIVIEHSVQPVNVRFTASFISDMSNERITGTDLWVLDVFLNDRSDGTGNQQRSKVTVENLLGGENQDVSPGQSWMFSDITASLPVADYVCPSTSYVCVQLRKHPERTFTLSVTPPVCVEIECRGVLVTSVSFTIEAGNPFVEFAMSHMLTLDVEMQTDGGYAGVTGQRLWMYDIFLSPTNENSLNRIAERDGTYTLADEIVSAGQPFTSLVGSDLDLSQVSCQDASYLCVVVSQGSDPSVEYTFEQTNVNALRACEQISCQGVDLVRVIPTIRGGSPFLEQSSNHNVTLSVSLEFSQSTASVKGEALWDVEVFTNPNNLGTGSRSASATIMGLSGNVTNGMNTNVDVFSVEFDLSNSICSDVSYLCVRVRKHIMAVPNFQLNPEAGRLACVPTNCVGALIEDLSVFFVSGGNLLEVQENRFVMLASFMANEEYAALSDFGGRDIWGFTLFISDNINGSGHRERESIIHESHSITPGGSLTIPLEFNLDLFNFLCNTNGENYVCLELGPGQGLTDGLSVTYPHPWCMSIECRGVSFLNPLTIERPESVLLEYTDNHMITFNFRVGSDLLSTTVENGTNAMGVNVRSLWTVSLTGDNSEQTHTSTSPFYLETIASLTPAQATSPFRAGVSFEMSNVQARMNLSSFYCPQETYYVCVTLDKDENTFPDFTLENQMPPFGCVEIGCRGVYIETTVSQSSQFIRERQFNEEVTFDLEVAAVIVSSATAGQFLQFRTFISDVADGGEQEDRFGERTLLLSSSQQDMSINPGQTVTFENLVAAMDLTQLNLCNPNGMFFCIEITKNPLSSITFKLEGSLVGCTQIECRGVLVTSGTASPSEALPLKEGRGTQSVGIDVSYTAASDWSSIFGQNLWQIQVFASDHPSGEGTMIGRTAGVLGSNGANQPLIAGQTTSFSVTANINLGFIYRTCSELQYICGVLSPQPSQFFGFDAEPSFAATACARFECTGVVIRQTELMVTEGSSVTEDNPSFPVVFNLILNVDVTSSTLEDGGSNRWKVEVFGNSRADGLGERTIIEEATLPENYRELGVSSSLPTTFTGLEATLDFSNQYCNTLQFLCAEVSVGLNAQPPFRFSGLNGEPERLIGCQKTDCIGVRITGGNLFVPSTTSLTEGLKMDRLEKIDVLFLSDISGSGASGLDLWTLQVFLATSQDGSNPFSNVSATLAGTAASQTLTPGGVLNFFDTSAVLDTTNLQCSNDPHICVTLGRNSAAEFGLNGYDPSTNTFNEDILTVCSPITCSGVMISDNNVAVIQPTQPIYAREDNSFCFNVTLTFADDGGSVVGSNLWDITAFMSQTENEVPEGQTSAVTVTLTDDQRNISAIPGNQAAFENLKANLSLDNLNCPSGVAYFCVRINSNSDSVPKFSVSGRVIGCVPLQCTGLIIESTSVLLLEPESILENTLDQSVTVDITLNVAENSANFELQENLWLIARIFTADADRTQSGSADTIVLNRTDQARTSLTRGRPAIIRGVFFPSVNTVGSQCQAIPYICVTLVNDPRFSVTFLDNSQTACARIPCRGVEILAVNLQGSGPHITERDPAYNLVLDVSVESDVGGAGISGTSLWSLTAFFDTREDCTGNAFPDTRTQYSGVSNRELVPGQTLSLNSNLFLNMDLLNLLCPDVPLYLCVEFDKQPDSDPPFTLTFFPDETAKYSSVEATCQGVEVTMSSLSINTDQVVREGDPSHDFNINFFVRFAPETATVTGTNLWELVIYGSRDPNGQLTQEFLTTIPINNQLLRNQAGLPSVTLFFTQLPVTVDLRGIRCANYPYVCVKINRDRASNPAFTFSSNDNTRIDCVPLTCDGIDIATFVALISDGKVIFEGKLNQPITSSLSIQSSREADPAVGNNYWRPFVFFNDQEDGNGPAGRISLTEMTIEDEDRRTDLLPGGSVLFTPANANVDFTTSCNIGKYMCFEIFNGVDLAVPTHTLLGNVIHCVDIVCVGLVVTQTNLNIQMGSMLQEGASSHEATFTVTVTSDSTGANATLSPMWEIRAFLTNRDNSGGIIEDTIVAEATVENVLSASQRETAIPAGTSVNFNSVQSSFLIEELLCKDIQFLCVEFAAVEGSSHSVTPLNGESGRLVDCEPLDCTGLEVISSKLDPLGGEPLISNEINHELILSFEFVTSPSSVAFEGQRLFRIRIFPNNASDGTGVTPRDTNALLELNQFTSIQPNTPNLFASLFVTISLQGIRCDQMPYMCGTLLKGTSPSPEYTLQPETGSPVLTACTQMLSCIGIQVTELDVTVLNGLPVPEDAIMHTITSMITVSSSPDGGSVEGSNLWTVRVFMSSTPDGQGERFFEETAIINEDARSAPLPAGGTVEIDSSVDLSLDGFSCSISQYLCHEFARDDGASVDFTLEADPSLTNGLINCQQFLCRGVTIDAVSFSIDSNQGSQNAFRVFELSPSFQVTLDIEVIIGSNSVTVTGTDLWQVTVFLSDVSDGNGTRLGETLSDLTPEQGETTIFPGQTALLTNVEASLDLTNIRCTRLQYLCIEVWNGGDAIPQYRIDDPTSPAELRQCQSVSCAGVEILSVTPVFLEGPPILLDLSSVPQTVIFDVQINASRFAAGVQGTNLWQVEAYISSEDDVGSDTHEQTSQMIATLTQSERNKPLQTSETLTLEQATVDLMLDSATCEDIVVFCVTLQKGPSSVPDFDLQTSSPASCLTGCTPVECADAAITGTSMSYGPATTLERDPAHTIRMNITAETSAFGKVITENGLWQFTVFGSNGNPGDVNTPLVVLGTELTNAQRNVNFIPGTQLQFTDVEATLDLSELSCEELTHFCVQINFFLEAYELRGIPDESSLIACSPVDNCGDFEAALRVTNFDELSISVAWSGGIGDFNLYEISYFPENGLTASPVSFPRFGARTLDIVQLTPGQEYSITLRLKKADSDFQDGSVTVLQRTLPEKVTNLVVEDINSQSFEVTWNPVGGILDDYVIHIEPGGGNPPSPHSVPPSTSGQIFENLIIATSYSVTVVSRSGNLESRPSEVTGFTTPTMPILRLVEFTSTEISVEWTAPAGYTPARYRISYSSTPVDLRTDTVSSTERQYTLQNLFPTTRYDIRIVAEVEDTTTGTIATSPSSNVFGTTGPDKPIVDITSDSHSIDVTVSLNRGTADSFRVDYQPAAFSSTIRRLQNDTVTGDPITFRITNLPSATLYIIDVVSIYQQIQSDLFRRFQSTRVNGPINLVIDSVTSSSITFSWQRPDGMQFDDYRINVTYRGKSKTYTNTSTTFTADNLPAYTDILISVEARYEVRYEALYNGTATNLYSVPVTTRQRTASKAPGPVRNATIRQVEGEEKILLRFEIPEEPNGELEAFIVTNTKTLNDVVQSVTTATIMVVSQADILYETTYSINVVRGCNYTFTVTARNDFSDGQRVTTNTILIPQLPPTITLGQPLRIKARQSNTLQLEFSTEEVAPAGSVAIKKYTLIVAEDGQPVEGDSIKEPLSNYTEKPEGPYQAFTARDWPSDGVVIVDLGTDSICGSFIYCNGQLKPGTTYLIAIRVYNEIGYDTSDFVPFETEPLTFWEKYMMIILIASAALFLVILLILIICIISCVCCCCSSKDKNRVRSSKGRRRKSIYSDSESESSQDGLDNINLNNATVLVYNPEERNSSAASLASRLEGGIVTRPVPMQEFAAHVGRLSANSQEGFEVEFESLHDFGLDQSTSVAVSKENKAKNRFSNILPYNNSRVVLHGDDDYINASFITGANRLHEFIATQGPMEHTVNDFWRMIWEQQVPVIVMICDIVEGGKTKCEEYWPPLGEPTACGEIRVTMLSEKQTTKGKERQFKLEIGEHSRSVSHFQYLGWPDKGVPSDTNFFTLFVKDIRSQMKALSGPVVIHCSDGASRTGVFIALDIVMQGLARETGTLDVYGVVGRLRQERVNMVLSKNYYVFLHQAVLDILLAQVSDSNWTFGATTSHEYDHAPLEGGDLLGAETNL